MEGRTLLQYLIDISDITVAKKQEATEYLARLEAAAQQAQADVCPSCGVDDWAYGDDTNTFEVCAMCGKRRTANSG